MSGTSLPCSVSVFLLICVVLVSSVVCAGVEDSQRIQNDGLIKKVELYDGVYLKIPERTNDTRKLFSLEVDTGIQSSAVEGRKKQQKLLQRILPMFIMPFLIQSAIIPMFLSILKFMLFKAMMIGKVALGLVILNAFRNHNVHKGRDSEMAELHYGYQGSDMFEYGAYIPH
ncbi:uncharacterized protein Osi22 [Plodia interpunctella]|uniref:uncharacterized protein Osi22 n=1 Tax=Plodia interpunctella TaxID=58824 RepID=UPI0023684BF5|nr:uncharacterized protein LOC128676748 [Plodia interpunctella]